MSFYMMVINNTQIKTKLMNTLPRLDLWPRSSSANVRPVASQTTLIIVYWSLSARRLVNIFWRVWWKPIEEFSF